MKVGSRTDRLGGTLTSLPEAKIDGGIDRDANNEYMKNIVKYMFVLFNPLRIEIKSWSLCFVLFCSIPLLQRVSCKVQGSECSLEGSDFPRESD
jgi:hypothetical protein